MATSGSWDYSLTAAGLISAAFEDLGIVIPGGTVPTAGSTMALTRLNLIAKQYQGTADGAPGMKIHTRQRITLLLAKGQQSYLIGPASTDARSSTQVGRTTIRELQRVHIGIRPPFGFESPRRPTRRVGDLRRQGQRCGRRAHHHALSIG